MTPKPKFSFVIPVYNPPENLFRRCLESCLDQEGVAFEIVVVNDGSTNNVGEILDEYASRHPGIFKIVTQENKGNGPAKKAGLENASGEFLWVIDNDDRVRPNCIKRLVDALEQYGADQILFKAVRVEIADLDRPFPPCDDPVLKLERRNSCINYEIGESSISIVVEAIENALNFSYDEVAEGSSKRNHNSDYDYCDNDPAIAGEGFLIHE